MQSRLSISALAASTLVACTLIACTPDPDENPPADPCAPIEDDPVCEGLSDERPTRRSELAGTYDKRRDRLVIFSGSDSVPEQCEFPTPTFLEETWVFHVACGKWELLDSPGPRGRVRHMMTYDETNDRALLFGGRFRLGTVGNFTNLNDVWELDLATNTWTELLASSVEAPTPRVVGAWVADTSGDKAYLFGGNISLNNLAYNPLNDLWEFDLNTQVWTELSPTGGPPDRRLFIASLWDPARDRMVIFGGADETAFELDARYFNDVWAYTPATNSWEQLHDGSGAVGDAVPAGRFWGEWVYDEDTDRYRLFAGHDDQALGNSNDHWIFDPADNSWELVRIGDTFNRESNGFCDFPPDYTVVHEDVPERRNSHVLAYSTYNECPGMIVTMGKTDCGATDDVQRFRFDESRWEELNVAREGEACLRRDSQFDCLDMCF